MNNIKLYSPALALAAWAAAVAVIGRSDIVIIIGLIVTSVCVVIAESTRHRLRAYGKDGWLGREE